MLSKAYITLCEDPFPRLETDRRFPPVITNDKIICFFCYIQLRDTAAASDQIKSILSFVKHESPGYSEVFSFNQVFHRSSYPFDSDIFISTERLCELILVPFTIPGSFSEKRVDMVCYKI